MEKEEIFRYIKVGSNSSISVDRCLLEAYPGIIRNTIIRADAKLQIDFLDQDIIDIDEGEATFYFYYKSYEELFQAVEEYIGIKMINWTNYNKTEWYPDTNGIGVQESWKRFTDDFINRKIEFPKNYQKFEIVDVYWEGLYNREIKTEDSVEFILDYMEKN